MVTLFNRRELTTTMSMEIQAKVRDVLATNNIEYSMKTKNLQASLRDTNNRARIGTSFSNVDYSYEYKIYVRKEDYERAVMLDRNC